MSTRVSLAPRIASPELGSARLPALPLLGQRGARVILGTGTGIASDALAAPIAPSRQSLFGPRGVCLCGPNGPLVVSDTGHHRLLIWNSLPDNDGASADIVIGQPDFFSEGRNAHGSVGTATLNVPTGVAVGDGMLAVADAWNHRVLLWHGAPQCSNQPADVVLGQEDFGVGQANRGKDAPSASTLNWCYGVAIIDGRLYVADTGNRRVLVWDALPKTNGAPADRVLGQRDFVTRDEGSGGDVRLGMRWPHAVTAADGYCLVADAGTSRIMVWHEAPRTNGVPCDFVLGQSDFAVGEHNGGHYLPTAAVFNMPYGIAQQAGRIVVADTANSRLLGFPMSRLAMGVSTESLAGQTSFDAKGDNRWQAATRDSLCWPYAVTACCDLFAIADTGNNRVLLWDAA